MSDRVRKPESYDSLLKLLKDEERIFSTYKDILIFAACLAKSRGQKGLTFSKSSDAIPLHVFSGEFDRVVINAIALNETDGMDMDLFSDENLDKKIRIFEEFAAAGLKIINDEVLGRGKSILESFMELIADEEADENLIDDITALTLS